MGDSASRKGSLMATFVAEEISVHPRQEERTLNAGGAVITGLVLEHCHHFHCLCCASLLRLVDICFQQQDHCACARRHMHSTAKQQGGERERVESNQFRGMSLLLLLLLLLLLALLVGSDRK